MKEVCEMDMELTKRCLHKYYGWLMYKVIIQHLHVEQRKILQLRRKTNLLIPDT